MAALEASRTPVPHLHVVAIAAAGVVTGLLAPLPQAYATDRYLMQYLLAAIVSWLLGAAPFAVLAGAIARIAARCDPKRAAQFGVGTLVAFGIALLVCLALGYLTRGTPELIAGLVAGPATGLAGSAAMAFAAGWLGVGPRTARRWWPMLGLGTALGALLGVDLIRESNYLFVLFPAWQAGVAAGLFLTMQRWQQVRTGFS